MHESDLAFALLGLLGQEPRSGYDLRKVFSLGRVLRHPQTQRIHTTIVPFIQQFERLHIAITRGNRQSMV